MNKAGGAILRRRPCSFFLEKGTEKAPEAGAAAPNAGDAVPRHLRFFEKNRVKRLGLGA
ncbi:MULTISPECIES: hypothetical protein [Anaerotruncus]|jgi:hypothetical protein|uniref:hypothetical protein n=1 Tax=Anaerotruncus TaxID=244127 RepID=UPI001897239F|nr:MULTISPECIES: hypothetical protein [Anaerotruncus]